MIEPLQLDLKTCIKAVYFFKSRFNRHKWLSAIFIATVISSCSQPIMLEQIGGQKEITKGEKATFFWKFQHAQKVKIDGDSLSYNPLDQITVEPQSTTEYLVRAISGSDTLTEPWKIKVIDKTTAQGNVERGGSSRFTPAPAPSATPTSYYNGYMNNGSIQNINRLKVVRILYPKSSNQLLSLAVTPLDANGNFQSGLNTPSSWKLYATCNGKTTEYQPTVTEQLWSQSEISLKVAVCLERSSAATATDDYTKRSIGDFPFSLSSNDQLSVVAFNQESSLIAPFSSKDKLNYLSERFGSIEAKGLNSMLKATYQTLKEFDKKDRQKNILVLIASSSDNASLIYTPDDVIAKAKESGTTIYTISVGESSDSYSMKYIASQTGGRYYFLGSQAISELPDIMREIVFATRGYYYIQIPYSEQQLASCKNTTLKLVLNTPETTLEEKTVIAGNDIAVLPMYQAIAMFNFKQTLVADEYKTQIETLANVLNDNPTKVVELVGHSSNEGEDDAMKQIALERAQSIRRMLYDMKVNPTQIRARAIGDLKPIYYFQENEWQKQYNRRVEIRWLDPSVQPYEIIAEYHYTESEAIKTTEQWEKRGFKSYYERVLVSNAPAFRVKLWGFPTEESALTEARAIEKKYALKVSVE